MTVNLLKLRHPDVIVLVKGDYDASRTVSSSGSVNMRVACSSSDVEMDVFDGQQLVSAKNTPRTPIFFENGRYELLIMPQQGGEIGFFHEYDRFRNAITKVEDEGFPKGMLSGTLHFQSEVGLSEMEIQKDGETLFTFTIEVFPTKLDYQQDYMQLLNEVNEEVYNLAYALIKKTYLNAGRKQFKDLTYTEFYRILEIHIEDFQKAVQHVERFPHHHLETTYEEVRGERLRQQDSVGLQYLRNNAHQFIDVKNGITIGNRTVMPKKGLLINKQQNYDTHENRYVKWAMQRVHSRVVQLKANHLKVAKQSNSEPNASFIEKIEAWQLYFQQTLQKPFWRNIGTLDRSVYSLVMQMATGYKQVFQVYMYLAQSLVLQNDLYKMSVKDVATLYEYWAFLKLGKILEEKTKKQHQDIVQVKNNGLYIHLMSGQTVTRTFEQPLTKEKITLCYQYKAHNTPTVNQEPDTMLSIEKHGSEGLFCYIFDAKYAIHVGKDHEVGPEHRDINVMHRYRDAIVAKNGAVYEREAFGAYVLFPWKDDAQYRNHPLYKSIEEVNIGGLPFLPGSTKLVERVIDNLLYKSGEELQREGILPRGTLSYLTPKQGMILVLHEQHLMQDIDGLGPQLSVPFDKLPDNAVQVREIAIANEAGVHTVVDVVGVQADGQMTFTILNEQSHALKANASYQWQQGIIVPIQWFDQADCVEELFAQYEAEQQMVKVFKRISEEAVFELSATFITGNTRIVKVIIGQNEFEVQCGKLIFGSQEIDLLRSEYEVFRKVLSQLVKITKYNQFKTTYGE